MTTLSPVSDDELALDSSRGSRAAFETLYERHHRGIYDLACRIVRDQDAAADVVQTTFTNAWVSLQKRRVSGNIRAWLYAIARNAAISELRRNRRRFPLREEEAAEQLPYAEIDRDRLPDPERVVLDKEVAQLVWDSAAALNAKEYSLLDLHLRKGFTTEEMAGSLGLSRGNVHTMLFRLRRSLEESVTGVLLARRGRIDCEELDAILAGRDTSVLTMETRRLISHHLESCSRCQENRRRFVSPAEIFAGLVLIPMPEESRLAIWKAIGAGLAAGGAAVGVVTHGAQEGARWLLHGVRSAYGMGAMGAAVVAGVITGAIILTSSGGGGLQDPADVRSTSHTPGRVSTERVVVVTWTPQDGADGYSVSWSRREEDLPDNLRDLPGTASRTQSRPLSDGSWYFHLRTEGGGKWTSTVHVGPFVIRGTPPATPAPSPRAEEPSPSPVVAGATQAPETPTPTPTPTPVASPPATPEPPAPPTIPPTPVPPVAPPAPPPTPLPAVIDIKPGNGGNNVNPNGRETIAVALVSTDLLPASRVNVVSARFAGAPPDRWTTREVNGDGIKDLVLHFTLDETSLGAGDREACLEGATLDGLRFLGCSSFTPIGPGAVKAGTGGLIGLGVLLVPALTAGALGALRRLRTATRGER